MKDQMQEVSVSMVLAENNLIVPEIQREYVWGFNQYDILKTFINDLREAYQYESNIDDGVRGQIKALEDLLRNADDNIKPSLIKALNEKKASSLGQELNIGFLYSYKPNYELGEEGKDLYLIDGQQRFTTLILFLFYFSIKEDRKMQFLKLLRFNEKLDKSAFDYRVRNITHDFLIDLFTNVDSIKDFNKLTQKNWFLANYRQDTTVRAIVGEGGNENGVFNILNTFFSDQSEPYFDFILNKVKFWHFKTDKTDQGEELYITMNSRGQQLADYENIRAKLFEGITDQLEWSEKWENWQDYFWKHRGKDSADPGFNEFLRWVVILEMIHKGESLEYSDKEERKDKPLRLLMRNELSKLPVEYLSLQAIDRLFESVKFLYQFIDDNSNLWEENYPNLSHNSTESFNIIKTEWLSGKWLIENKRGLSQIELFRFLPIISYLNDRGVDGDLNAFDLFRLIRWFYNRSKDENIGKSADQQIINGIKLINEFSSETDVVKFLEIKDLRSLLITDKERRKLTLLSQAKERVKLEELFWLAEDYDETAGDIDHLIELCLKISEDKNIDFHEILFGRIFDCYKEVWEFSDKTWGDLINSEMYFDDNGRVWCSSNWERNTGLMNLVNERFENSEIALDEFLKIRRKEFIKVLSSEIDLKSEKAAKKQLYIYYIITVELLQLNWIWDDKWNFGIYESVESCTSLFDSEVIYERFGSQWRYNSGYYHGLWIQENADLNRDYLQELIDWSKT
jgi:hypothetical protein